MNQETRRRFRTITAQEKLVLAKEWFERHKGETAPPAWATFVEMLLALADAAGTDKRLLANHLLMRLFVNDGQAGDRLVLTTLKGRVLGEWAFDQMIDKVEKALVDIEEHRGPTV